METRTAHPPTTPVPVRGPRVTLWLLRLTATAQAGLVLLQPVLAGWYLSGDYDALSAHEANAQYIGFSMMASFVSTLLYWLPGRGRAGPFLVTVAVFAGLIFQFGAGYERNLALHIPLGVGIVAVSVLFGIWTWRPAARQARRPFRWPW